MTIHLSNKSLVEEDVQVIVNPANGIGLMGAGAAGVIARAGGEQVTSDFQIYCKTYEPRAGTVFMTRAGNLRAGRVYHAVTMRFPGTSYRDNEEEGLAIVKTCIDGVFSMFNRSTSKSIAVPALGTGIGGLNLYKVAEIMVKSAIEHGLDQSERKLVFCDINKEFLYDCKLVYEKLKGIKIEVT